MRVRYREVRYSGKSHTETDNFESWLLYELNSGGIEQQIAKLRGLMVLLVQQWVAQDHQRIVEVADIVAADDQSGHEIVVKESD